MSDLFLEIPLADRAEILQSVAPVIGLPPHVLEKDVWVCWALQAVFEMPDRLPIAFKGGTSLSKVFGAIRRFSEDIDLTIDYTALSDGVDPLATEISAWPRSRIANCWRRW
jgi:predicted nucleotidyltransferase component of viral defense system